MHQQACRPASDERLGSIGWPGVILALACVSIAPVSYGLGTVLQAAGARRATVAGHLDVMLLARLGRQLPYLGGLALDAVGFVAALVALRTLPLFVVQAAVAGSVGVTALTAARVFGFRLRAPDKLALGALILGLGVLCASARGQRAAHLTSFGGWMLLLGVVVVAAGGVMAARRRDPQAGVGLAACAGFAFAGTAIAARAIRLPAPAWHVVAEPVAIALLLYGACGMLMFASALQRGSVTGTSAMMFAVQTIVPAVVGLAALGDGTRPHFEVIAILGFGLTVGASLSLARYTEAVETIAHEPAVNAATQ
jgi:drug/metabolite transporter (DMT)-like permease